MRKIDQDKIAAALVGHADPVAAAARLRAVLGHDAATRAAIEVQALRAVRMAGARPAGVGDVIPACAPARAHVAPFTPRDVVVTDAGNRVVRASGWQGWDALRPVPALERMQQQSERAQRGAGQPLFTLGQQNAAAAYAALFERCESAGIKCASVEGLGTGGQGSFIDAVLRDAGRLRAMQAAVGRAVVLSPRHAAPHADRGRRRVLALDLVNEVCVADRTISDVMRRFGWARKGATGQVLRVALCAALDRIQDCGLH